MSTNQSNFSLLRAQLKKDLFFKDSQSGYTYTYAWMANQTGHFALGFMIAILGFWIFFPSQSVFMGTSLWVPIGSMAAWTLYEIFNYANALIHTRKNTFKPNALYIAFDTSVDLCFFYYGIIVAYVGHYFANWGILLFFGIFILYLPFSYYWLLRKLYYQKGNYPYMKSLSEIQKNIKSSDAEKIVDFTKLEGPWKHILVFGGINTGKTDLAVAIAIEKAIKKGKTSYTTFFKWVQMLQYIDNSALEYWPWRESKIMVIDDVNPSIIDSTNITPDDVIRLVNNSAFVTENKTALSNMHTIWVLGEDNDKQKWVDMLQSLEMINSTEQVGIIRC